jgi:serine protease inhibitor
MRWLLAVPAALMALGPPPGDAQGPADGPARLATSSNAFGLDIYARLKATPGNLAFSPASLTTGLAMAWGGARGETASRMQEVMHLTGAPAAVMRASGRLTASLVDRSPPIVFRIANRLFGDDRLRLEPVYLEATRSAYGAALEPLAFRSAPEQARRRINGWVEEQTEKRIRDLVPAGGVSADTRLVLVNAIYFLGDWEEPFEKESTRPAPFFLAATRKTDVPTMHQLASFRLAQTDGLKALDLPYKGGKLSMLVVIPEEVDGLGALESSLSPAKLERIVTALAPTRVSVALPKFEVNPAASLALGPLLQSMGMGVAFDTQKADFTGIANPADPRDRLAIGNVFHKAFVRVDEKGTEAAAATGVAMRAAGMPLASPVEFKADRPFLFFLRDGASGLVLFMGRVVDPTAH